MESTPTGSDFWLVRTILNEVRGPYSKEALIKEILDGKLGMQDEVCRSGSYWIYLDERSEVSSQLGIEIPRAHLSSSDEENTDTKTEHLTQEIEATATAGTEIPELEEVGGPADSRIMSNRALRRFDPNRARLDRRSEAPKPLVLGKVEQSSFWRIAISIMIILTGFLVAWVIRVLQTSP